jgi:hypothetical protein
MSDKQAAELERVLLSLRKLRAFMGLIVDKLDLDPEATIAEFSADGPDGTRLLAEVTAHSDDRSHRFRVLPHFWCSWICRLASEAPVSRGGEDTAA